MSQKAPAVARAFLLRCRRNYSWTRCLREEQRPATAPRQSPPTSRIRTNAELYEQNCVARNYRSHAAFPRQIAEKVERTRKLDLDMIVSRRTMKNLQQQVNKTKGDKKSAIIAQMQAVQPKLDILQGEKDGLEDEVRAMALSLPNMTSAATPTDNEPSLMSYINYDPANPPQYSSSADHSVIGDKLGLLDFAAASGTSGWGFYYLMNEAALLEQALVQYALSILRKRGWTVVSPPSLVYSHMAAACGFQPRDQHDEQQIWQIAQADRDAGKPTRSLAATAEIPLAGLYAGKAIPASQLPIKVVGTSRCFRAEAGARGVDTKGLYRVHEFTKVEMFGWTDSPRTASTEAMADETSWTEKSAQLFNEMVEVQTEILSSLGLPCRVLEMPSSDLGASAYRKIDIEAMFPSRSSRDGGWGEVTSVSNCTDYQSRRLDTRVLEADGSRKNFAHTVNGTALAVPRVLAALLENGWRERDGSVVIPEVLKDYMGGLNRIGPR